jgi:hypothetical protein
MLSFKSGWNQARVWLAEAPPVEPDVLRVAERTLTGIHGALRKPARAAVELFVPVGGRALYGLLGAEFRPGGGAEGLTLRVDVSPGNGPGLPWALAAEIDDVREGLPEAYVSGVLDGAATHALGPGTLHFRWAAHGAAGSSEAIFRRIAQMVVTTLARAEEPLARAEWIGILRI